MPCPFSFSIMAIRRLFCVAAEPSILLTPVATDRGMV